MITERQHLGLGWEIVAVNLLILLGIDKRDIQHNPFDPDEWVRYMAKGADIKLSDAVIECKFIQYWVGTYFILRDWIPRFEGCEDKKRIIFCNRPDLVSFPAKMLLKAHGISLMGVSEFKEYIRSRGVTSNNTTIDVVDYFMLGSNVFTGGLGGVKMKDGEPCAVSLSGFPKSSLDVTDNYLARSKRQTSSTDLTLWSLSKKFISYLGTVILGGLGFNLQPLTEPRQLPRLV